MRNRLTPKLGLIALLGIAPPAAASWSLNLGYRNPRNSLVGLNLLYLGSNWGFEVGVGHVAATTDDEGKQGAVGIAGDLDIRYLFGTGKLRPYILAGFGAGVAASTEVDAGAGAGQPFVGLGLHLGLGSGYLYAAVTTDKGQKIGAQVGLGFDL